MLSKGMMNEQDVARPHSWQQMADSGGAASGGGRDGRGEEWARLGSRGWLMVSDCVGVSRWRQGRSGAGLLVVETGERHG